MPANFKVSLQDTDAFAKVWTHNGIAVPMTAPHVQFANDYANVVLANFIRVAQENAQAAREKAIRESIPKITLE